MSKENFNFWCNKNLCMLQRHVFAMYIYYLLLQKNRCLLVCLFCCFIFQLTAMVMWGHCLHFIRLLSNNGMSCHFQCAAIIDKCKDFLKPLTYLEYFLSKIHLTLSGGRGEIIRYEPRREKTGLGFRPALTQTKLMTLYKHRSQLKN